MLTIGELEMLLSPRLREVVSQHIDSDPRQIALDKKIPHSQLVASQVKYLQKARKKLPSFYRAGCILPGRAYEQASSEIAAAHRHYSGKFCLDLGSGLGVDTYYLSKKFNNVMSVERDPVLAEVARSNFELLGCQNISVLKMDIHDIFELYPTLSADLVFLDPDRRGDDGKKKVTLAECSPNIEEILPRLRKIAPKIVIKLSPIFDIDEAVRIFGPHVLVDVVSVDGECKEVTVEIDESITYPIVRASGCGSYEIEYPYTKGTSHDHAIGCSDLDAYKYLIIPDVALSKSRLAKRYFHDIGAYMETDGSYAFSNTIPDEKIGKIYEIISIESYAPKKLQKKLSETGIKKLNIFKRSFPYSNDRISKELGIKEGGTHNVALTTICGKKMAIFIK